MYVYSMAFNPSEQIKNFIISYKSINIKRIFDEISVIDIVSHINKIKLTNDVRVGY
jgi:hypothetical protein